MESAGTEHRGQLGSVPVFWHEAPPATDPPVVYLHGVPSDADDWLPFLEHTGGLAPDLPGFGRSGKQAELDYSIAGYSRFLDSFLAAHALDRVSLVVHDWGAAGLALAQERPERVERLVVIGAVPFLPGYRWHRVARLWRTPLLGELAMGFTSRRLLRRSLRAAVPRGHAAADALADRAWERFDHGSQRAILKLYRSAPPAELERAGARLGDVAAPALVVWGEEDPFLPVRFAHAYADALGGPAEVEVAEGAGHWPWLDRPELVQRVVRFLSPTLAGD